MSVRNQKLVDGRTLQQHRDVVTKKVDVRGDMQYCLEMVGNHMTDLSAAVAKLIDVELMRNKKRRRVTKEGA